MGPPLKAAENRERCDGYADGDFASMGPPLKAAENQVHPDGGSYRRGELQWGRR